MSKTIREHIAKIQVERSNLQHIASTGQINGSLLISIEKAMRDYNQSQTQELQEQNAELVSALQSIVNLQDKYFGENDIHRVLQKKVFEIEDLLTKHNHLKSNTNG